MSNEDERRERQPTKLHTIVPSNSINTELNTERSMEVH